MWLHHQSWPCPLFLEVLMKEIKNSPIYTRSFDESLNEKLQKGQMDFFREILEQLEKQFCDKIYKL